MSTQQPTPRVTAADSGSAGRADLSSPTPTN